MATKKPLKINLVLGQQLVFPPIRGGGVENLTWALSCEFSRLGHEVIAYSRAIPDLPARETDKHGIKHVRVPGSDLHPNIWRDHINALRWGFRLRPLLEPADVTSFHTAFSFLLRYRSGLGVCTHTIHRTPKAIVSLYRNLDRVYCGADAVVHQAMQIDSGMKNLKRVYNCIEIPTDLIAPDVSKRTARGLTFLYVGRFVRDKGLESLIKGFEQSTREYPNNRLATIGAQSDAGGADTIFFKEMSSYVVAKGIETSVDFIPAIFDRAKLVAKMMEADVICVPSLSGETFSMAVLEGMALGKPVIVSDFGPMPEAIDHKVNGYVAKAGNPESLKEAISFFSEHCDSLPQYGAAALEKVRERFSSRVIASEYLADFQHLIARNGN
jgi:glycosyltransferase involved in cell wall biosynthesis